MIKRVIIDSQVIDVETASRYKISRLKVKKKGIDFIIICDNERYHLLETSSHTIRLAADKHEILTHFLRNLIDLRYDIYVEE